MSTVEATLQAIQKYKPSLGFTKEEYNCDVESTYKAEGKACKDVNDFVDTNGKYYRDFVTALNIERETLQAAYKALEKPIGKTSVLQKNEVITEGNKGWYTYNSVRSKQNGVAVMAVQNYMYFGEHAIYLEKYQMFEVGFKNTFNAALGKNKNFKVTLIYGNDGAIDISEHGFICESNGGCYLRMTKEVEDRDSLFNKMLAKNSVIGLLIQDLEGNTVYNVAMNWDAKVYNRETDKLLKTEVNSKEYLRAYNAITKENVSGVYTFSRFNDAVVNGNVQRGKIYKIFSANSNYKPLSVTPSFALFKNSNNYNALVVKLNAKGIIKGQDLNIKGFKFKYNGTGFYKTVLGSREQMISVIP
ncbi:hypothetical protein, partial [Vibrio minamisatsumaniensis]|uniref:hypothetical protein n=1 Tax=Vibrio minamisatsumaniensis TaxID=2910243 RepID=UPI003D240CA4